MPFDKFTNFMTSIQCFEDQTRWDDGIGDIAMEAVKAKVLSAVDRAWQHDCTVVAVCLVLADSDKIKELWQFLNGIEDLRLVFHDVKSNNSTKLEHKSGKSVICFFIFGGKLVSDQLSAWDKVEVTKNGFDLSIGGKKERNSINSAEGLDWGADSIDITGQGMTQSTEYHFTPKKVDAPTKTKKAAPMATRRSTRTKKN
jgi:hypothetical protein